MIKIKKKIVIITISVILICILVGLLIYNGINNAKLKEEFKTSGFADFSDFKKANNLLKEYNEVGLDEVDFFNNLKNDSKVVSLFSIDDVTEQKYTNNKYLYTFKTTVYPYNTRTDYEGLQEWHNNSKELTLTYEGKKIENKYLDKVGSDDTFMFYGFGTYKGDYKVSLDYIFYNLVDE